jgi:GNAT superfamily N-acetyltransferase
MRANVPPGIKLMELVAERHGTPVGHGLLLERFWTGIPGSYAIDLRVDLERRGQGIGSSLYEQLLSQAQDWAALRLFCDVREDRPDALQFALTRGFHETGHVARLSKLDVEEANFEGYEGLPERLEREGIRVTTLAELGTEDEELLRAIHGAQIAAAQDEPAAEPLNIPFDQWRDSTLRQPGVSPETVWVAMAGANPIGVTMLQRMGADAGHHFGMAVDRRYRGRGVARLLKLRQIEWARDRGVRFLFTGNDINNPRMYDINVRLGYKPLPASIGLVKDVS